MRITQQETGRAILTGGAVAFNSGDLVSVGGDSGKRLIRVQINNASGEPITNSYERPRYPRLLVGNLVATDAALLDIRSNMTVSTFAGTGAAGAADGYSPSFNFPACIIPSTTGALRFFVSDRNNNTIRVVEQDGAVRTYAGAAGAVDGIGTAARFSKPGQMAMDGQGNLFVADELNNRIRRISPVGDVRTIAGTGAAGSTDGSGDTATFLGPAGIAVTRDGGTIFVADAGNHVIRRIEYSGISTQPRDAASSYEVSTIAGTAATPGLADGQGGAARFRTPYQLALVVPSTGSSMVQLYVADRANHAIRRLNATSWSPATVSTIVGNGTAGAVDGVGANARLNQPVGIVSMGDETLVVTEMGGHTVRVIRGVPDLSAKGNCMTWTAAGAAATTGTADGTGATARFNTPLGLCVVPTNGNGVTAYVADGLNHKIRKITGALPASSGGIGSGSNELVRMVNYDAELPNQTAWAKNVDWPTYQYQNMDPPSADLQFYVPAGVSGFSFTVMLEVDTEVINMPAVGASHLSTLAGNGMAGTTNGLGKMAQFSNPVGVAAVPPGLRGRFGIMSSAGVDSSTATVPVRAFVSDFGNHRIRYLLTDGSVGTYAGGAMGYTDADGTSAQFKNPRGIGIGPDGAIFVADTGNFRIRRIELSKRTVTTVAGTGVSGTADGPGNTATIGTVEGLTVDQGGPVWFTDLGAHIVRRLDYVGGDPKLAASYAVTTVAGTAAASGSTDATGAAARFNQPYGVVCDTDGTLYVADQGNHTIRKLVRSAAGLVVTTLAGTASAAGTADGTGAAARFNGPLGIAVDQAHNVYVSERNTHRIRRVSPIGGTVTLMGTVAGFVDGLAGQMNLPRLICMEHTGNLLVIDYNNSALRVLQRVVADAQLPRPE